MKEIKVLWSHPDDPTIPPLICPDTCRTVKSVLDDFQSGCGQESIIFTFQEEISEKYKGSNACLSIDGIPLEKLVPLPDPSKYCGASCADCGSEKGDGAVSCSRLYEQIPESVLRLALSRVIKNKSL